MTSVSYCFALFLKLTLNLIGSKCGDLTNTNWSECNSGYFYHDNGWYDVCPDGFYGNKDTWEWSPWHEAWTRWADNSTTQWSEWNSSLNYALADTTWNLVVWVDQFYLNTTDLTCHSWNSGCLKCEFPNVGIWNECDQAHRMVTPGSCTKWNDITGYKLNSFGVWEEIWGDGLNFGQHQWDDNNTYNGDGWSNTWEIETGYKWENTSCWEIVRPTATISSISKTHLCTVTFSEEVVISDFEAFEKSLKSYIHGPLSPYKYLYEVYDPLNKTKGADNLTEVIITVHDIQAPLDGGGTEKIEFWIEDLTTVKDIAGNKLSEGKFSGNLNYMEFISESENIKNDLT